MRERRNKPQIYADILASINEELIHGDDVKITRIQLSSKLSYDKVKKHLVDLEKCGLVECTPVVKVTEKGRSFMVYSKEILDKFKTISDVYLSNDLDIDQNTLIKIEGKNTTNYFVHDTEENQTMKFNMDRAAKEYQQIQNAMQAIIEELDTQLKKNKLFHIFVSRCNGNAKEYLGTASQITF